MSKLSFVNGQGSIILRVIIKDSSSSTGTGLTGLSGSSPGLIVSAIADNEATTTAYAQAGSNIEGISTLGIFAAPTTGKCRFREVDSTNHKGLYEIQIGDARWAVGSSKAVIVSIHGATNAVPVDAEIELTSFDHHAVAPAVTLANSDPLRSDWADGGRLDLLVDTIVGKLPSAAYLRGTSKADGGAEDVDGVTAMSFGEALLAYVAGESVVVDNGDGTKTITYKKQDGVSSKLTITFNTSGEFTGTVIG